MDAELKYEMKEQADRIMAEAKKTRLWIQWFIIVFGSLLIIGSCAQMAGLQASPEKTTEVHTQ